MPQPEAVDDSVAAVEKSQPGSSQVPEELQDLGAASQSPEPKDVSRKQKRSKPADKVRSCLSYLCFRYPVLLCLSCIGHSLLSCYNDC